MPAYHMNIHIADAYKIGTAGAIKVRLPGAPSKMATSGAPASPSRQTAATATADAEGGGPAWATHASPHVAPFAACGLQGLGSDPASDQAVESRHISTSCLPAPAALDPGLQ